MKYLVLGLSWLTIHGCSHLPQTDKVVTLPFAPELLQEIQHSSGRSPASLELEVNEEKSSRRVYFSSLYHQYLSLGQYLNVESSLTFCPQFHHDKIETDAFVTPNIPATKISHVPKEERHFFPELAFNKKFSLRDYHSNLR